MSAEPLQQQQEQHQQLYSCKLCLKNIECSGDLNRVHSVTAKFNPWDEIRELSFELPSTSHHICRNCRTLLVKRNNARKVIAEIDEKIFKLSHGIKDQFTKTPIQNKLTEVVTEKEPVKEAIKSAEGTMQIDLQVTSTLKQSLPLVIGNSQDGKEKLTKTPKPLLIKFNSDRKKVKIIENTKKCDDKNFHDYCESSKDSIGNVASVLTPAQPAVKSNFTAKGILYFPQQSISVTGKNVSSCIRVQLPSVADKSCTEKSAPFINKPPMLAPKVPPCFQNPIPIVTASSEKTVPKLAKNLSSSSTQTASSFPTCWYLRVPKETSALVSVRWPSSERHKIVPRELVHLAISIVRGSHQDIAKAVWNHDEIQKCLMKYIQKDVGKEADMMCSEKYKSILKKNSPEELMEFTFDKMDEEMKQFCPLFYAVLKSAAMRLKKDNKIEKVPEVGSHRDWKSTVCIAASACLCQRSVKMHALEMMMNMLEDGEKKALPNCVLKLRYIFVPE